MNEVKNLLDVQFVYLPVINFAMQQNRVALIRQFSIENKSTTPLVDVTIDIQVNPAFASTTPYFVDVIPPGEIIRINEFKLDLSVDFFAQLTERFAGNFTVEIFSASEQFFRKIYPVDILAFDEWGGLTVLPEMLSAFIMPNNPALVPVIRRAASILEKWTGSASLNEYQSRNPDRVQKQMAAVYAAIAELGIIYSAPPASFETYGQRVRLVDTVLSQKLGTCLDMALLYASCLESIGIHPLIVITKNHAFAGAWLVPETFPDTIIDDASFLTKRTADGINEILLVETTGMNQGAMDFDAAVKFAGNQFVQLGDFVLALDVKRTRFTGIRPLPQRVLNGLNWEILQEDIPVVDEMKLKPEDLNPYDLSGISSDIQVTKQLLWERKLLDLSLRNNLLNVRVTKNTLQLISADLDRFEDALAEGDEFSIYPKPSDWENPLYDFGLYQTVKETDPVIELVKSELTQKRLRVYLNDTDLKKSLQHLYRSSRLSIEENGANTLYLALGLLKWYETTNSERPRYAPILLLPVEIVRKSVAKGYIIRSREEETMMNITLLEMLRQNFGITITGLDPLPTDEKGVNVKLIYSIIRKGIKDQPKWDVEEQAILGIFSFNKFIMWNDIHNNAHRLIENKIVSSLINGKIEWNVSEESADAAVFDKTLSPAEIVLPINADSSQLEAVYEAVNEKSFILHGPPGTGKSQTITNIIANALYRGKRVLFVAEKMAALSVVQSRLNAIGLAPFCLELHSNKAKKTAVLSQLKATTEIVKQLPPENFKEESVRLHNLRLELCEYVESLHRKYDFGLSLYDAVTNYLSLNSEDTILFPESLFVNLTKEKIQNWQDAVELLVSVGNACGHPHNHPLTGINIPSYSASIKDDIAGLIAEMLHVLVAIKSKIAILNQLLGGHSDEQDRCRVDMACNIVDRLLQMPELMPELLTQHRLHDVLDEFREVVSHGKLRDELKNWIVQRFSEDVFTLNAETLLADWNQAEDKWFLSKYIGRKKVNKQLKPYILKSLKSDEVKLVLTQLIKFQAEKAYIEKYTELLPVLFGKFGKKDQENWDTISQIIEELAILDVFILNYANDVVLASATKAKLAGHLSAGIVPFKSIHGNTLTELARLFSSLSLLEERLSHLIGIQKDLLLDRSTQWLDNSMHKLKKWEENLDKLKDWYRWLSARNRLEELNIGFVAEAYCARPISTDTIQDVFYKGFYKACIHYILSKESRLELFKGQLFDDVIQKYKDLAINFEALTRKELYAKLAANIPSFTIEAAQNSEVGILQRNIRNNARGVSLRKLFDQIPTLVSRMAPCMLMSPISVAQYIDPDADKFDLVIFDEASQMPTYEAVGAIARGKSIVIVGDPKQMPPTNFFTTNTVDEDNIELEDLESILDDCLALSMPSKYLLWHYRSKHESLIAFSNSEYYENKLLTFPSPDNIESKVRLVPVKGCYDMGRTRQNKEEAQAVVDEVVRRLSDKNLRKKSIGIVTFSVVQQALIEDLLSDLFIFRHDLEKIAFESEEPLFIKNLENVQGDERDVILFSIGYGPDKNGKVSMNFGPLNRVGGERRLNVAVSRARYEMIIFSTLRSDQIDLNRTSAVGVAGLKRFLEYAERGERSIVDSQSTANLSVNIEHIIADALREKGYEVHTNIGCSGYRIDIGVVDKSSSGYILGILCDGENYRQTKTVRDREIVQNGVLKALGWNIYKVWTIDWWEDREQTLERIIDMISKAKENGLYVESNAHLSGDDEVLFDRKRPETSLKQQSVENNHPYQIDLAQLEQRADLTLSDCPSDMFYAKEKRAFIVSQLKEVIDAEAPISRSLLCKRIMAAWMISRFSNKLDRYFDVLFSQLTCYQTMHDGAVFFWKDEEQKKSYTYYRINSGRDAVDLPPEEIANAVVAVVKEQIGLPVKDAIRIVAQLFGFSRSGTNVEAAMQRGIDEAVAQKRVKLENDRVIIV